jgi:hypothetical protein
VTRRAAEMRLSIEIGSEPIAGSIAAENGVPQKFSGWIELVAAIESARHQGATTGGETLRAVQGASGARM